MKSDALEQKLQRRPTLDELVKEGILEPGEAETLTSPSKSAPDTASYPSKAAENTTGSTGQTGQSYLEQAQNAAANVYDSASKTAQSAANYVSGTSNTSK